MGPREFKALEGLTPVEARLLVTSLVDDVTASGIGEMLQQQEATKQVGGPAGAGRGDSVRAVLAFYLASWSSSSGSVPTELGFFAACFWSLCFVFFAVFPCLRYLALLTCLCCFRCRTGLAPAAAG